MQSKFRAFLPVFLVFIILNAFFLAGNDLLNKWNAEQDVLMVGNLLLFLITLISFFIAQRGLNSPNPHAFTRAVFGSILLKLFVCIIAATVYIATYKSNLNKPALFGCMGLYLVYTFMEVSALTKMLRGKAHG
jgi:Na+/H+ antiporter NhaC